MNVRVLYFATLRQNTGLREESISLGDDATLRDLRALLANNRPAIQASLAAVVWTAQFTGLRVRVFSKNAGNWAAANMGKQG